MAEAEIIGYVMERTGQRARVKIDKSKSTKQNLPKFLDCWNACEEKIGTQVRVEVQTLSTKKKETMQPRARSSQSLEERSL